MLDIGWRVTLALKRAKPEFMKASHSAPLEFVVLETYPIQKDRKIYIYNILCIVYYAQYTFEEHVDINVEKNIAENEIDETDFNVTFQNPYLVNGFPRELCDFQAKSNSGLQLHVKAKHKENEMLIEEPRKVNESETAAVVEPIPDINFNCDQCEFFSGSDEELQVHITEKHGAIENFETSVIKLEVFCLVQNENDVYNQTNIDRETE